MKQSTDENTLKILRMPPFQERWTRLLNQTLPHSPLKSTETVQRSCITVNVTRAAQTLTGEDNAAEPSSSDWRLVSTAVPQSCRGKSVIWQFIRNGKNGTEVKRHTWICQSAGSHWSLLIETSTCLLHVLWWGSWLWRWRTRKLCLWNSEPGGERRRKKKPNSFNYFLNIYILEW